MKRLLFSLVGLLISGCGFPSEHLLFTEESHVGLKVKGGYDAVTPVDIDFGYRRSVLALIPKIDSPKETKEANETNETKKANETKEARVLCEIDSLDSKEPLSVISVFNSEVSWFTGTQVHTYFATGRAATQTACDVHAIKALVTIPQ